MKKRTKRPATRVKSRRVVTKTRRRRTRSSSSELYLVPVTFRRVVFITGALLLFVFAFVFFNKGRLVQSVAGVSIARGLFAQATVALPNVDNAVTYNVYYKQKSDPTYSNAVRNVPANATGYTISYLKKGAEYEYKISAADGTGREFWWSDVKLLTNLEPM